MKTRITLVTGEKLDVDISIAKAQEKTTDNFGKIFNDYVKVNGNTWVAAGHIVKLERINDADPLTVDEDDDTLVQY